jgi:hypothetical protein
MKYVASLLWRICTGCGDRMAVWCESREEEQWECFCSWECMKRYDERRRVGNKT